MEWFTFIEIIAVPIIGWIVWQVNKTRTEVNEHRLHVAETYATKAETEKTESKIYAMLAELGRKLDRLIERGKDE